MSIQTAPGDHARPGEEQFRLAKSLGVLAIGASALTHEYGATINYVSTNSLSIYPGIQDLVPWAMLVAGLLLIPKVFLYIRFSSVMPRAGSIYVWMSRSLSLPISFVLCFLDWVGLTAAMGFIAYVFGTFLAQAFVSAGIPAGTVLLSPLGHLVFGVAVIWTYFAAHLIGVHIFGRLVVSLAALIFLAVIVIVGYGYATDPATFVALASAQTNLHLQPPSTPVPPTFPAFAAVTFLFIAAYGGLTGAPALGGEAHNASKTIPQGLFLGWLAAVVLYTAVSAALFYAVPWWATLGLINGKASGLATVPGLISVVAPKIVGTTLNFVVALIVGKTIIPQMMVCSRLVFGFAQDHVMPATFLHTSRWKTPDHALLLSAGAATLFLAQSCFGGWAIGIVIRSFTVLLMLVFVALGALNVCFNQRFRGVAWADAMRGGGMRGGPVIAVMAVLAIAISLFLLYGGLIVPNTPWYLQPLFQGAVAACIAILILLSAQGRARAHGLALTQVATNLPLE
ncbi:MAG TPA: APC family permease [Acetobacteraceae bacterium]|jgi:amino acid transporter|nr:APC family permease [Acetobacteraceae bacterium]